MRTVERTHERCPLECQPLAVEELSELLMGLVVLPKGLDERPLAALALPL